MLLSVLREVTEARDTLKKGSDVHKAEIIGLYVDTNESSFVVRSVCARGLLAEWDPETNELIQVHQLSVNDDESPKKVRHVHIDTHSIVICQAASFGVFDISTKQMKNKITPENQNIAISAMAVAEETGVLAYTQNKTLHIVSGTNNQTRSIQRETKLTCAGISQDGTSIAVSDEFGKIYHVMIDSNQKIAIQTLHWHANSVSVLIFAGPYLLSGGEEATLVQWHLEKQDRSFVARVGH